MDKSNFKKLALMGMAGGMLLSSQTQISAGEGLETSTLLAAGHCGGKNGCGGSNRGYQGSSCGAAKSSCGASKNSCGASKNSCGASRNSCGGRSNSNTADAQDSYQQKRGSGRIMTENELMSQLNEDGKATYRSLDSEGKALALKLASQDCKGKNDCKGLNSCRTDEHSCAGQGSCRGTSKGPFSDKNNAVKLASKKMAEKRASMSGNKAW